LEGRVSRLNAKVTPPGTARDDWMIAVELAFRMGGDLGIETLDDIWSELSQLAPSHAGITRARLASREGLDGIVAGRDETPTDHPPTMAQTDAPEIVAAAEQGETQFTPVVDDTSTGTDAVEGAEGQAAAAEAAPADEARPDPEAEAEATEAISGDTPEATFDASGGASRPAPVRWAPASAPADPPPADSYSLRLVVIRKLYDGGTFVQHSPSLARLSAPEPLHVNPTDLERLGVRSGGDVRVTGSRTTLTMPVVADTGVPRGTARLVWNQPGDGASELIDSSSAVTDVRVETL
ncbi:MAG TPA: molybdopterin dinucleotide binding domain-containing protein, partial [Acidimicrobiales bacterium]|nr:molybdopterin dinucleotide binding domain-containing protein [Acidimicrobiales bacterium]